MINDENMEPRQIKISLVIEGYPFHIVVDGYYHKELDEEIVPASESIRFDNEVAKFRTYINGIKSSTSEKTPIVLQTEPRLIVDVCTCPA
jgi:hypothetical protein